MIKLNTMTKKVVLIFFVYIITLVLFNTVINDYYIGIVANILINIILAVSLNLVTGFLGQLALGHAGFMAIGAYTSAIITTYFNINGLILFPFSILISGILAAIMGILIGIPALRLKGDYLAIITLAFGEVIKNIILNVKITGGARGLSRIKTYVKDPDLNNLVNFSVIFWICVLTVFVISRLIKSRHGRAIISIREDEVAAEASGINTTYYKIFAFSLGAFFAGIAGALFAHNSTLLDPNNFNFNYSIEMVIMVVLGGMGNILGSIIAAIFLTALPQILSDFATYRLLIYSLLLVVVMLLKNSAIYVKLNNSITNKLKKINFKKKG